MTAVLRDLAKPVVFLLAVIFTDAAVGRAQPQTITLVVEMVDDKFVPDHLIFKQGVHYQLHLENHGRHLHEFTASKFFDTAEIDNPDALNPERTEVVLQPGETTDVFLTLHRPGTFDLRCADHDWEGMVGDITVE
jgi:uncharacterized cupredoxin-like copper-binding protein